MISKVLAAKPEVTSVNTDNVTLVKLLNNILLDTIFPLLAAIAVGAVIFSGVLFMISRGDPEKLTRAKRALLYSVIGVLLVVLSYVIVLVLSKVISNEIL